MWNVIVTQLTTSPTMTTPLRLVNKVKSTKNRYFSISIFSVYICIQFPQIYSWKKGKNFFFCVCSFCHHLSHPPDAPERALQSIHSSYLMKRIENQLVTTVCLTSAYSFLIQLKICVWMMEEVCTLQYSNSHFSSPQFIVQKIFCLFFHICALIRSYVE